MAVPMKVRAVNALCMALFVAACGTPSDGEQTEASVTGRTLASVKARGHLRCGVRQGTVVFGSPDKQGYWRGIDVDTCRAIAAAVLGNGEKARSIPLTEQQRLTALQSGDIDVLPRTTT